MSDKLEELMKHAAKDSAVGEFLVNALAEHCVNGEHMSEFLVSLIMNLGVNKLVCPHCVNTMLAGAVDEVFDVVDNEDGTHSMEFKENIAVKLAAHKTPRTEH